MNIFINQPFGIGDIIFCMTIARRYIKEGHKVMWGVFPQFLEGLQRAYPDVNFVDYRSVNVNYELKDEHDTVIDNKTYRVLPLRWNVELLNVPYDKCMGTKYTLVGSDYKDWKGGAMWQRDEQKENELFDLVYHFPLEYKFVNNNFQSDAKGKTKIQTVGDTIDMRIIDGYSLFDWVKVIEKASEIHTVSTSILYILELLDLKMPIHLYPRPTDPKFKQVSYLFTKDYILH